MMGIEVEDLIGAVNDLLVILGKALLSAVKNYKRAKGPILKFGQGIITLLLFLCYAEQVFRLKPAGARLTMLTSL